MTQYDRRKELLEILYQHKHETMSNLAFALGVSRQTIQSDITALSIEHPEIEIHSGRYGEGVFINFSYIANRRFFTPVEVKLLQKLRSTASLTHDEDMIIADIIRRFSLTA